MLKILYILLIQLKNCNFILIIIYLYIYIYMRYVIKRSCTNKKAKYPQEYNLEELKILAKKLNLKKWKSLKKGELCKKISKHMKRHFYLNFKKKKHEYKPIIKKNHFKKNES